MIGDTEKGLVERAGRAITANYSLLGEVSELSLAPRGDWRGSTLCMALGRKQLGSQRRTLERVEVGAARARFSEPSQGKGCRTFSFQKALAFSPEVSHWHAWGTMAGQL